jgi:sulfur-oxidizing protein SoxZ
MKIKAKMKRDMAVVKVLAKHPMETGLRKDKKTDKVIPAKFIKELVGKHGDKVVFHADFGRAVSKNPYVSFSFAGAKKGDTVTMTWTDNTDETVTVEAAIK